VAGSLIAACAVDDEDADDDDVAAEPETDDEIDDEAVVDDPEDDEVDEPDVDDDEDDTDVDDDDRYGGRMVIMAHGVVESLHPDDAGPYVEYSTINNICEPLLAVTETHDIEPTLATDYDVSDDGLTYTFQLREGVVFHDGEDFTADDVKYAYEWYMDVDNAALMYADFRSVESVEAEDDYTVIVTMSEPDISFLRLGAHRFVFPEHYHEEVGYEGFSAAPVGTGPFQVLDWTPDEYTLLGAFDDHWDGRPYLDELEVRVIPEPSVRALEMETGGADSPIWPLGFDDALRLQEMTDQIQTIQTTSFPVNHFPINNEIHQFDDSRVRQALMYAVDRQQVVDNVYAGAAVVAHSCFPPALEDYYADDLYQYEYDPDRAVELLEEAGWEMGDDGIRERNGDRLEWTCAVGQGDETRRPHAEMLSEFFSEIGAQMNITEVPSTGAHMREGGDMALFNWNYGGWEGEPDARIGLSTGGGDNYSHYSNEEMDELLAEGVRLTELEDRQEVYRQVQELFVEDVPFLYQTYWDWFNQFSIRVQGLPDEADVIHGTKLYRSGLMRQYWLSE
jgi:peptide/nickel transport system substrate-binding protein